MHMSSLPLDSLLAGDCIEVMMGWPAECIDLIFADPPYNLSGKGMQWEGKAMGGNWETVNETWDVLSPEHYARFTRGWLEACHRLLTPTGSIYISCTHHNLGVLMVTLDALGLRCNNVITWYKPNAMPSMTRRNYTHATEFVLYFVRGPGWTFNYDALKAVNPERRKDGETRQMRDLWTFPVCQGRERLRGEDNRALHPTQKPEGLLDRVILGSSRPGDVVLDPFVGSGTTAAVAKRLGRRWIGIDREERYLVAARQRLQGVKPDPVP